MAKKIRVENLQTGKITLMSPTAIAILKKHNQFKEFAELPDLPGGPDDTIPGDDLKNQAGEKVTGQAEVPVANPGAENPGQGKNRIPAVVTNRVENPSGSSKA